MEPSDRDAVLQVARDLAASQHGGTLATIHAEDGTPYVAFVACHLRTNGEVLFGSSPTATHARNILATREVSMLIDNREVITSDWAGFLRVVIEGDARSVPPGHPDREALLAELQEAAPLASYFSERGELFRIRPRRVIVMKGMGGDRRVVEFDPGHE